MCASVAGGVTPSTPTIQMITNPREISKAAFRPSRRAVCTLKSEGSLSATFEKNGISRNGLRVKRRNTRGEHMFSALAPIGLNRSRGRGLRQVAPSVE
jgi:hypothetical protein